jgi:hypothetical protein
LKTHSVLGAGQERLGGSAPRQLPRYAAHQPASSRHAAPGNDREAAPHGE